MSLWSYRHKYLISSIFWKFLPFNATICWYLIGHMDYDARSLIHHCKFLDESNRWQCISIKAKKGQNEGNVSSHGLATHCHTSVDWLKKQLIDFSSSFPYCWYLMIPLKKGLVLYQIACENFQFLKVERNCATKYHILAFR